MNHWIHECQKAWVQSLVTSEKFWRLYFFPLIKGEGYLELCYNCEPCKCGKERIKIVVSKETPSQLKKGKEIVRKSREMIMEILSNCFCSFVFLSSNIPGNVSKKTYLIQTTVEGKKAEKTWEGWGGKVWLTWWRMPIPHSLLVGGEEIELKPLLLFKILAILRSSPWL